MTAEEQNVAPQCHLDTSHPFSARRGPHLGPADMTGQLLSVQNSVMVPYSMLIWLKKSTAAKGKRPGLSQV